VFINNSIDPQRQRRMYITCVVHAMPYTRKNLTSGDKFVNTPSTSYLRTACRKLSTSLEQAVKNLKQPCCYKRLFQQVRYSHDIAVLLQLCVVNLVTFLFIETLRLSNATTTVTNTTRNTCMQQPLAYFSKHCFNMKYS
jgi:hypothetical protein